MKTTAEKSTELWMVVDLVWRNKIVRGHTWRVVVLLYRDKKQDGEGRLSAHSD